MNRFRTSDITSENRKPNSNRSTDPGLPRSPVQPNPATQPGKSPIPFTILFFGLPLVIIVLIEYLRLHS